MLQWSILSAKSSVKCFVFSSGNNKAVRTKNVKFCVPEAQEQPAEEYDCHLAELAKEWSKPKTDADHVNVLLRDTFANRRRWITSLPAGVFMDITEAFPCFMDGQFVSVSFFKLYSSCISFYCMFFAVDTLSV